MVDYLKLKCASSGNFDARFYPSATQPVTYLNRRNECVVFRIDVSSKEIKTYVVPSAVVNIFSLEDTDCCFCRNGSLYTLDELSPKPSDVVDDVFEQRATSGSSEVKPSMVLEDYWEVVNVSENNKIFFDDQCCAVCPCSGGIAALYKNELGWTLRLYPCTKSSSGLLIKIESVVSGDLPCRIILDAKPVMICFHAGSDGSRDCLSPVLFSNIFGSVEVESNQGLLISVNDGQIFAVNLKNRSDIDDQSKSFTFNASFCMHQAVVSIHKARIEISCGKEDVLVVVGILGKIILVRHDTQLEVPKVVCIEIYCPGPIKTWFGQECFAVHLDNSSIWLNTLCGNSGQDDIQINTMKLPFDACAGCFLSSIGDVTRLLGVFFACDGSIFIVPSIKDLKFDFRTDRYVLPMSNDVKHLLADIYVSSTLLSELACSHTSKKKILNDLSCAAHLLLSEDVKTAFKVTVKANWSSSEGNCVTLNVRLSNTGDFSVEGCGWTFVIVANTSVNKKITKTVPLKGIRPSVTMQTSLKVFTDGLITDLLPIGIACGLQYALSEDYCSEFSQFPLECVEKYFTYYVQLFECTVDVFHFFDHGEYIPSPCAEISLDDALWKIALQKSNNMLPIIRSNRQRNLSHASSSHLTGCVAFYHDHAKMLFKGQQHSNDDAIKRLLEFMVAESSLNLSQEDNCELKCYLFGQKVKLTFSTENDLIFIRIHVSASSLLVLVKCAILRKLKLNEDGESETRANISNFTIPRKCLADCLAIRSALSCVLATESNLHYHANLKLYRELRENVSAKLPYI